MNANRAIKISVALQWVLMIILLVLVHPYDSQRMPDILREYLKGITVAPSSSLEHVAMLCTLFLVLAGIIGSIGVFRFKSWGRRFYTIAVVFTPILTLFINEVRIWGPFESILYDVGIPLEGFTVALLYFSEARHEFGRLDS